MTAFRVSIVASDETLLWAGRVDARDGHEAKQQAPDWTASLIANRLGNAERHAAFSSLVSDIRAEHDLKAG